MFKNITDVVKNLLIINVIIFLGTTFLPYEYQSMGMLHFYESKEFQPFQLVTSMFMHANLMHLAFNMMSLYFLGPYVERTLGAKRFLILYLASGFGASLLHIGINAWEYYQAIGNVPAEILDLLKRDGRDTMLPNSQQTADVVKAANVLFGRVLGASGCVYGVMIAFATMFPNLKLMVFPLPIPIASKYIGVGLVILGLYQGFDGANDGIAHFAHVGGAIVGFILIKIWKMSNLH